MAGKVTIDLSDENDLFVSSKLIAKILGVTKRVIPLNDRFLKPL